MTLFFHANSCFYTSSKLYKPLYHTLLMHIQLSCNQLKPNFLDVCKIRNSALVKNTLEDCIRLKSSNTKCKQLLTHKKLTTIINHYATFNKHNDLLFIFLILTGFYALLQLRELTQPDNDRLMDDRKVIKILSVHVHMIFFESAPSTQSRYLF